jgi:membrane-associated phospholipid phosphatase
MRYLLLALTDFGDVAVLIPLGTAILIWLLFGNLRSATWWMLSVGLCVGLMAILKIYFYGCPPASDIRSPSGHTGFSVLVYGAIAFSTALEVRGWRRTATMLAGAGFITMIGVSRLLLEIHSLREVILGLLIGTVSLILFGVMDWRSHHARVWPLLVAAAITMTVLHGQELHAEEFLHRITGYLRVHCS